MSAISPTNANSDANQKTMELRLLNIFYKMQEASPHPFMPIAPNRIKPLPESASGTVSNHIIHRLIEGVHPESKDKGEIRVGSFHASVGQFYETVMDAMSGSGLGKADDSNDLRLAIALALGADSFKDLEKAYVVEGLSNQVKKQFAWVDEWYWQPKHLISAQEEVRQFDPGHPKHSDAIRNVVVWERMRQIDGTVEAATLEAIDANVLDKQAIVRLSELTNHFYNADFGGDDQGRDWAPRSTATLKAVSAVAEQAYERNPNVGSQALVAVVRSAMADHERAKEVSSPEKFVSPTVDPSLLHIFGSRYAAAAPVFQPQIAVA